jgi:hypothetical protein
MLRRRRRLEPHLLTLRLPLLYEALLNSTRMILRQSPMAPFLLQMLRLLSLLLQLVVRIQVQKVADSS